MHAVDSFGPWESGGYTVWVDFSETARLAAEQGGVRTRTLPAAVRGGPDFAWMKVALEAAREHQRGIRALLETAMVEAIPLDDDDLAVLALDPAGRPLLSRLLFAAGPKGLVGRPLPDEWLLETVQGELIPLAAPARVVHPVELHAAGALERWDRWLNRQPRPQPIKQIRREVFLRRPEEETFSARFAGAEVRWDQARALLEGRGWHRVTKATAERNFARVALTAHLEFRTPAARGWDKGQVVVDRIYFLPRGEPVVNQARPGLPLERVPPALFSEALRDAGLISLVAGGSREPAGR
jgi:hypothetical protein